MSGLRNDNVELILPFDAIDRAALPIAGGKAANLGELNRAGLPIPDGFCVTTAANDLAEAIANAYRTLGDDASVPVAVRSSATAEDLPYASFAGQQDTYLNVVGEEAVLEAVRSCWASLWTDRAVAYRATGGIDHRGVRLAVAVQRMVGATVAGILFTANPLTRRRRQAVIDASLGLGEAVVSGAVNPDHFVVNTGTGEVVERRLGDKRVAIRAAADGGTRRVELAGGEDEASLDEAQIRALATLVGSPPRDLRSGPGFFTEAGGRLFLDITRALRSEVGRGLIERATRIGEERTAPILRSLADDPRLASVATPPWPILRAALLLLIR